MRGSCSTMASDCHYVRQQLSWSDRQKSSFALPARADQSASIFHWCSWCHLTDNGHCEQDCGQQVNWRRIHLFWQIPFCEKIHVHGGWGPLNVINHLNHLDLFLL